MRNRIACLIFALVFSALPALTSEVRVIGQMKRMFTAHDIGPNVELATVVREPHVYALGPVAGLKGEITVFDGQTFVSRMGRKEETVTTEPKARAIFLVYATVPAWRSISLPTNIVTETDLATFIERSLQANARTAFLVSGTAVRASYHVQNYQGRAEDLTHEAHDKAKVLRQLTDAPVQLVGFATTRDDDGGSFVHQGQTTHIHLIADNHKSMGHLEAITLAPGAKLFLPEAE